VWPKQKPRVTGEVNARQVETAAPGVSAAQPTR
jgi:hypothetical protein